MYVNKTTLSARQAVNMLGKTIHIFDKRTGATYAQTIVDVKEDWGRIRIRTSQNGPWFEPTAEEMRIFNFRAAA